MQLANQQAHRFRHEYIGTEHLLLGLVQEGSGVAANVLKRLDVDLRKIRREVELIVQHGPGGDDVSPAGRLPQTPRTKKVIEYAIEEARELNHNYVGTEHLLLGLLREQEGVAAQVLMNLGLELEDVREEVLNLLGHNTPMIAGAAPDAPKEDVVRIPKSLEPQAAETYPVSELPLVDLTAAQLQMIRDRIRHLTEQRDVFVEAADFVLAARCRDEADALARLLAWYDWARGQR
jgi:ATP-dependent Clp protease ATP-binding subunit ClpA